MKSIAEQGIDELGGARSVLSLQKRDHILLRQLLRELSNCSPEESGPHLIRLFRLVFPHAFAEEAVLWPAARRLLPDGAELTLRIEKEHQEINELMTRLEGLEPASPERGKTIADVSALLLKDAGDEEDILLPRLQSVLSVKQLRRLGMQWQFVRAIAPTRCHPVVSRRPPGNILSALPLTLLDRARDRLDMRRYRRSNEHVATAKMSGALTQVAHALEGLPGMSVGEDKATQSPRKSAFGWKAAVLSTAVVAAVLLRRRRQKTAAARSDG